MGGIYKSLGRHRCRRRWEAEQTRTCRWARCGRGGAEVQVANARVALRRLLQTRRVTRFCHALRWISAESFAPHLCSQFLLQASSSIIAPHSSLTCSPQYHGVLVLGIVIFELLPSSKIPSDIDYALVKASERLKGGRGEIDVPRGRAEYTLVIYACSHRLPAICGRLKMSTFTTLWRNRWTVPHG